MKNIEIREIRKSEIEKLNDMLYEAIYQPEEKKLIPREIIKLPEISVYIDDFGKQKDDYCLVADLNGQIIGAVWVRILSGDKSGFGNIDDKTPEFAISLYKEYRNQGIGTRLMKAMIEYLQKIGYKRTSLNVKKKNYAVKLYEKLGFEIIRENEEDYLMLMKLND